jgi:ssDNA-binding Zn-finger/Zn-ribbon topoisomerase 1
MKVKTICTHCGAKQAIKEIDYSLNYVSCKKCKKEDALLEIK